MLPELRSRSLGALCFVVNIAADLVFHAVFQAGPVANAVVHRLFQCILCQIPRTIDHILSFSDIDKAAGDNVRSSHDLFGFGY